MLRLPVVRARYLALTALLVATSGQAVSADVFVLENAAELRGELLNPSEIPREKFVIKTALGGVLTIERDRVKQHRLESAKLLEYQRRHPAQPDTVEGHWELAEWCRTERLEQQRETHLERIIQLEPNHELARRALGYTFVKQEQRWMTQEQRMVERGYVRYKGRWCLPQEVQLMEEGRKNELAEKEWFRKLKLWRGWLDTDRAVEARAGFQQTTDPYALAALTYYLDPENEPIPAARVLYVETVSRIQSPAALLLLARVSLDDPVEEVRLTCLDRLVERKHPDVVRHYVGKLRSKDNSLINRAALGLAAMNDPSAVPPLIDALVTHHKFRIVSGSGRTTSTFGSGGSGFSAGQSVTYVTREARNEAVRDALIRISGANFGFDTNAWKSWLATQRNINNIDARRD